MLLFIEVNRGQAVILVKGWGGCSACISIIKSKTTWKILPLEIAPRRQLLNCHKPVPFSLSCGWSLLTYWPQRVMEQWEKHFHSSALSPTHPQLLMPPSTIRLFVSRLKKKKKLIEGLPPSQCFTTKSKSSHDNDRNEQKREGFNNTGIKTLNEHYKKTKHYKKKNHTQ